MLVTSRTGSVHQGDGWGGGGRRGGKETEGGGRRTNKYPFDVLFCSERALVRTQSALEARTEACLERKRNTGAGTAVGSGREWPSPGWMLLSDRFAPLTGLRDEPRCCCMQRASRRGAPTFAPACLGENKQTKRAPTRYEHIKGIVIVRWGFTGQREIPDSETFQSLRCIGKKKKKKKASRHRPRSPLERARDIRLLAAHRSLRFNHGDPTGPEPVHALQRGL